MNTKSVKAYAKINLSLDVLRKRPDGYHDLSMIMQTIGVYDIVTCKKRDDDKITFATDSSFLSEEEAKSNLCVRAAKLMQEKFGCGGVDISLEKHIPIAAGLAGGSSDAAAVMRLCRSLFEKDIKDAELEKAGAGLGADIPYCIRGGCVLCEGIGDVMTNLPAPPECTVLLAKPGIYVSTAEVYGNLRLNEELVHPDVEGMVMAIKDGDYEGVYTRCKNVLAYVTEENHPIIVDIEKIMLELGADNSCMSGSGPTVFGLFSDGDAAANCAKEIEKRGLAKEIFVTRYIGRNEM